MHNLLQAGGLDRFYHLGGGHGQPVGDLPRPTRHDWIEESLADQGASVRLDVDIQGIHCAACVWLLRELWNRRPGAIQLEINPSLGKATLVFDPNTFDIRSYLDEVSQFGYRVALGSKRPALQDRSLLTRLGICVALALNGMMFAFAGYFGLGEDDPSTASLFETLGFVVSAVAVAVGGSVFFRAALFGLRRRVLHLDLPISLGIVVAFVGSVLAWISDSGATYFDTVTVFIALMLTGRYLQQRAVRRNRDYLLASTGVENLRTRVLVDGQPVSRSVIEIRSGDILLLAPTDLVPARVELLAEEAQLSLDWITGESKPARLRRGESIPAGAFLRSNQPVRVRVVEDARSSGLVSLLATPWGRRRSTEVSEFWSHLNRIYVIAVLLLATAALILWSILDPERALDITVAVLVVTCPCALGLAIPLAFERTLGNLRRQGIYVRTPDLLDRARRIRKVIFDKTGTLTFGDLDVEAMRTVSTDHRDVLLTLASSSSHPVSAAIVAAESGARFLFLDDLEIEVKAGEGLRTVRDGREYRLGSPSYALDEPAVDRDRRLCLFTCDGRVEGSFLIGEHLREGFREEIADLRASGRSVYLFSGDASERVAAVAQRLGIGEANTLAALSPQEKAMNIHRIDDRDTLMVGDGLNDAPAFEAAWCAGAAGLDRPTMPARADFFFLGGGSAAVRQVLDAADRLRAVVVQNLWLAGIYNVVAVGLSFAGYMGPLLCAVLMPASSLLLLSTTHARLRGRSRRVGR